MSSFKDAVLDTTVTARTDNGMKTYASSLNNLVDLFFQIGSSRGKDITAQFERAYATDRQLAMRIAFWARDVRGGAGEREIFRSIIKHLEKLHPEELAQVIALTPEYGRWDDVLVVETEKASKIVAEKVLNALRNGDGLCAKWMPRKGPDAVALRNLMGMTPKQYRKTLVSLTKVVESAMCSGNWSEINYEHVPSVASARYQTAFGKHDPEGYGKFKEALTKGEAKINANAVYPYDVIKSLRAHGSPEVVNAQWDALPNYMGSRKVLPMVDVSGSMQCPVGGNVNVTCLDVAISLGLYISDKTTGPFKDLTLTFSSTPKMEVLTGNISSKYEQLSTQHWTMDTNLHGAFDEILRVATTRRVAPEDMPEFLVILSDMEFNQCMKHDDSALEMIKRKFEAAGYALPSVIFWNLNAREGNVPVRFDEKGTALISGFSPAIMEAVLKGENITPTSIMLEAINSPRYMQIV